MRDCALPCTVGKSWSLSLSFFLRQPRGQTRRSQRSTSALLSPDTSPSHVSIYYFSLLDLALLFLHQAERLTVRCLCLGLEAKFGGWQWDSPFCLGLQEPREGLQRPLAVGRGRDQPQLSSRKGAEEGVGKAQPDTSALRIIVLSLGDGEGNPSASLDFYSDPGPRHPGGQGLILSSTSGSVRSC